MSAVPTRAAALTLAVACSLPALAAERAPTPPTPPDPSAVTIAAVRAVGGGMFSWLTNQEGVPMTAMEPEEFDWSGCPAVSHEEAAALLVPDMVAELPRTDGWGHPFELCLWRPGYPRGHLMGIRSPGRDGRFEGTKYRAGRFDPADPDRDLVWMDGIFVTWPQAAD
jgi:hypothetical protein